MRIASTILLVLVLAFFLEPLSVASAVYNPSMNGEVTNGVPNTSYNSDVHYGFFFPVLFRASEDLFGHGNVECAYNGHIESIGSFIRMECGGQARWIWAWSYQLKYRDVDLLVGYRYLAQNFMH